MNHAATRVRKALRDMVNGEQILDRIEYVTQCLLSGYELHTDPVTRAQTHMELTALRISALSKALDIQLRLLGKVLPDLKAVELTGADGTPLDGGVQQDRLVLATKLLAVMREQQNTQPTLTIDHTPSFLN